MTTLSLADWCILIAAILPYFAVIPAKLDPDLDNSDPRAVHARQEGFRRRSYAAHANAFEALPFFAAAVLLAEWREGPASIINAAALVFILARVAHAVCYVAGYSRPRSLAWSVGFLATLVIFLSPLVR